MLRVAKAPMIVGANKNMKPPFAGWAQQRKLGLAGFLTAVWCRNVTRAVPVSPDLLNVTAPYCK